MQALAGGAAGVGGRERVAAAQTKPAVAADGTAMLLSLGAAAGTPGPPRAFPWSPAQQSHPRLLGATSVEPSVLLLAWGGGQGDGTSSCRGSEGSEQHPSQATTPAPAPGPPLAPARATRHEAVQCHHLDPAPAWAAPRQQGPCREQLGWSSTAGNY